VLPRSRGGATTWENCVAACLPCNQRKGDRTPKEAGMRLRFGQPVQPRYWARGIFMVEIS
jgi:5-methylcytosine-specific restriction endonuclease McrA